MLENSGYFHPGITVYCTRAVFLVKCKAWCELGAGRQLEPGNRKSEEPGVYSQVPSVTCCETLFGQLSSPPHH